jgi:hypothetical protein
MQKMQKIYFGHPLSVYNTPKEKKLISIIEETFPHSEVENPNQPHHAQGYQDWKKQKGNGMLYYYEKVLPQMSAGVFLPFEDGMWGAGVFNEADFLQKHQKPIYEINFNGEIYIAILDLSKKLSIDETRVRTRAGQI